MMVAMARDLIDNVLLSIEGRLHHAVLRQEIQRTVYRWLRETPCFPPGPFVDLGRQQMRAGVQKNVQDGQPLGGYAEAKRTELWDVLSGTGHGLTLMQVVAIMVKREYTILKQRRSAWPLVGRQNLPCRDSTAPI